MKERLDDLAMIISGGDNTFDDSLLTSIPERDSPSDEERLDRLGNRFLHPLCAYDWALRTFRKLLQIQIQTAGSEETLPAAATYRRIGTSILSTNSQREEGIAMFQESARIMETILGPDHEEVARVYTDIGHVLRNQGEWDAAIEALH